MKKRLEEKNTIYIRSTGDITTIAIVYPNNTIYYDLQMTNTNERTLFNAILRSHKTWPINIMYEDIKNIRKWWQK